jgi:hypothetical protein
MMVQKIPLVPLIGGSLLAAGAGFAVPLAAQSGGLSMLDGLSKGEWTVRFRDGAPARKICVRTGRELIQLQHRSASCRQVVVRNGTSEVTVQYNCQGNGYGRTSIRRETATLTQIDSQGFAGGVPFQFTAEARRTGTCQ